MNAFQSVRGRLLTFVLCISLIPIAIITTVYYLNARSTLKKQTLKWLTAVAESRRLHILSFMTAEENRATVFSSDRFTRDSLEMINHRGPRAKLAVEELNRHLRLNKKPLDRNIVEVSVINMDGVVVSSTNEEVIGTDVSRDPDFTESSRMGTRVKQPFHYPRAGADCFSVFTPLVSKHIHEQIGVLVNIVKLEALSDITCEWAGMGETGEVYLVNRDGIMLTESRFIEGTPLRQVVDTEPIRKIAEEGQEMTDIYPNYRGVPVIGASLYLPEYGWTLLTEIDKAEAFAPIKTLSIVALIVGVISAAAVTSLGFILAISTSRPIMKLTDATRRFAGGDLESRVKITRKDEIGELADSFNEMAKELQSLTGSLERRVAERTAELKEMMADLERSNAELQQFAYVASHDLQEPLRMVASYTQLLARRYKGKLGADADEFIAFAVDGAIRMQRLINDLLEYSRVGMRGEPFKPTDCTTLFDQAVTNLQVAIEGNGAVVTHDALPTVMADAVQLGQVFQNLIENAIKFRGKEQLYIHVSAEQKGNEWVFSVRDNGIGIEPQYFYQIFIMFRRAHDKTDYPGTGIGLTVCRKIVERHGGRIWVESEPGKGSTFYFTIPKM
ncbi:MAG: ATP-binding protein [Candidatus Brocadiales bacterium]